MKKMTNEDMILINGGRTYRCMICGYRNTNIAIMVGHIYLAHYLPYSVAVAGLALGLIAAL